MVEKVKSRFEISRCSAVIVVFLVFPFPGSWNTNLTNLLCRNRALDSDWSKGVDGFSMTAAVAVVPPHVAGIVSIVTDPF